MTVSFGLKMANPHPIPILPEEHHFHQKDAIKSGIKGGLAGGAVGLFAAAIQNSLAKGNIGSWAVFTKHGATVASLGAFLLGNAQFYGYD